MVSATERMPLLQIRDLVVRFPTPYGVATAVKGVSLDVYPGETLGLVGESGSGKSTTAMASLRLLPAVASIDAGSNILLAGKSVLDASEEELRVMRGTTAGVIFQNPMQALNPAFTVGWQMREALRAHARSTPRSWDAAILDRLREVGLPEPARLAQTYPHQLSGGMLQRVMIAMSLLHSPDLLIADEPTTALDVTIQAQILNLLRQITRTRGTGMLLITHNLGVVARMCDRVAVLQAGKVVEEASVDQLFGNPAHPYTKSLLGSQPGSGRAHSPLRPQVEGEPG